MLDSRWYVSPRTAPNPAHFVCLVLLGPVCVGGWGGIGRGVMVPLRGINQK